MVSRVAAGEPVLSPEVTRQVIAHLATTGVTVGRGRSNAEISDELFMSVATVKAHASSILTELDLNDRIQVALLAHDVGLTASVPQFKESDDGPETHPGCG